ncbi:MAG: hypothetical protein ACREID_00460, partial [Planctomycetota bacterium]
MDPAASDGVSAGVDLDRLGIEEVGAVYDLTTPAGEPFAINVYSRGPANDGDVTLCIAHVSDGGAPPAAGPESLGGAGILPLGDGAELDGNWLEVHGNGYARFTVRGGIDDEQVVALCARSDDGESVALVRIGIGEESIINEGGPDSPVLDDYPGVLETDTLYTSDSFLFGLPAAAADGGLTHAVFHDGGEGDLRRFEVRLRHDRATGEATVLGKDEVDADFTGWRDHEIAARDGLVAFARSGGDAVTVRISFDGGATFGQTAGFPTPDGAYPPRLVQAAFGPQQQLALLFWRNNADFSTDLLFVEGTRTATET